MHRVDDHRGEFICVRSNQGGGRSRVVVGADENVIDCACPARSRRFGVGVARTISPDEVRHAFDVRAVERPLELHDLAPTRRSPGDTDRRGCGFTARRHESDPLHPRSNIRSHQSLGERDQPFGHRREVDAVGGRAGDALDEVRMGVADERRAPCHRVVDPLASVHIPQRRTLTTCEHRGPATGEVVLAVRALREVLMGANGPRIAIFV